MKKSIFEKLQSVGVRHFNELIHDQPKEWLLKHFKKGRTDYPINVTSLIRNLIWQTKERIDRKEKKPLKELIRTFWYMYIKPTLFRADSLARRRDQYAVLTKQLSFLVRDKQLMRYADIGFRDESRQNRQIGVNSNIILFAEKLGHQDFLLDMANQYGVTIIALKGQPSVLSAEYLVTDMKKMGVDIRRSFYLFSVVDFDTSGWIIRNAFVKDLKAFGIKNIKYVDLVHPDMLTPFELEMSKYRLPDTKKSHKKNVSWARDIKKLQYKNFEPIAPLTSRTGKKNILRF